MVWLLLLATEEGVQADGRDLDYLETDTGAVTDGMAATAATGDEDLVVLLDVVQRAVEGAEGNDALAVLDELDADALADGGVGLLGLNADLLQDDALGVAGPSERVGLEGVAEVALLVHLAGPLVRAAKAAELAPGVHAVCFCHMFFILCGT